jgi:trk system potassium uptake protein TrkH
VRFTLFIEMAGIVLLYLAWGPRFGWRAAAWPAVFHSVSAFCNAGFSTFSDSLVGHQRDPAALCIIMALVVVGGIGFLTLEEFHLHRQARRRGRPFRISLHTRLVVGTTAVLILGPWALFTLFEWGNTLAGLPPAHKVVNALFLSVTPRTAGFNAVDYADTTESTRFLTVVLMTIGGSPGSTAGGAKTTTFALVALLAWSRFRGREVVSLQGRSIPEETVQRAVGLAAVGLAVVVVAIFVLTASEGGRASPFSFLDRAFEAFSAVNTVGLSTGLTPQLSTTGRVVILCLMFLGRVGPLTLAAALAVPRTGPAGEFRYAYEDVAVG